MSYKTTGQGNPHRKTSVVGFPPSSRQTTSMKDASTSRLPTDQDIWKWTLTVDAIAPCWVRDVLTMRSNDMKGILFLFSSSTTVLTVQTFTDADFFWLGRVPCRSVRIVGLVVGLQVYEKRIVYSGYLHIPYFDLRFLHLAQWMTVHP
jgi:hypothetical protein